MKRKYILLFTLILFVSCTDKDITDINLDKTQSTTRSAGDGKYDALGYGYNCFYAPFSDPIYVQAKIIDLERLQQGRGRDQITGEEISFNPAAINESILHGRTETKVAYGTSISKLTEKFHLNASTKISTSILKLFSMDLEATINQNHTDIEQNSFYKVDALKTTRRLTLPIHITI